MASANDGIIDTVKDIIWDNLIDAALTALFVKYSWLAWGPLKWFVTYIVEKFTDEFYVFASTFLNLKAIALRNKKDQEKYTESSVRLYLLAREYGVKSKQYLEYKDAAKADFKETIQFGVAKSA